MKPFILAILLSSSISFANSESGGRFDKQTSPPTPLVMPGLQCHLRQSSPEPFSLSVSASTTTGISDIDIYAPGPTNAPVKIGQGKGAWSAEAENSVVLSDGGFLLRVFAFNSDIKGPFFATFALDLRVFIMHCSQK